MRALPCRFARRLRAFTLIEMLVVIIIIGILLAIGIPAYLQYQSKAKDAAAKADLTTAFKALAATKTMNNGSFPNQSSMLAQARTDEPGMSLLSGLSSSAATGKINVNLTGTTLTLATLSKSGKVITLTASSSDGFSQPTYASQAAGNGHILFVSTRTGNADVYIANADGTNQVDLTSSDASADDYPHFSPDGTKIVFASNRTDGDSAPTDLDIYVMNVDGSNVQELSGSAGNCADTNPAFTPDGSKVTYQDCNNWLRQVAVNGTGDGWVYQSGTDHSPRYSPDGSKLAIDSGTALSYLTSFAAGPFSGSNTIVTPAASTTDPFAWSPDSQYVYYDVYGGTNYTIYKAKFDGSSNVAVSPANAATGGLAVSPDGTQLLFNKPVSGKNRIYLGSSSDVSAATVLFGAGQAYNDYIWDWHS